MNSEFHNQIFSMYKFQPNNIILIHNKTRKLYCYCEPQKQGQFLNIQQKQVSSPIDDIILKAEPLCCGFVYEKQSTSLKKQILPRILASDPKDYFGEEELNNSFEGIIGYLQNGGQHGAISLDTILVDNQGNIKLKDPRVSTNNDQFKSDYQRVSFLLLQCALLKKQQEVKNIVKNKYILTNQLRMFSSKFIANVLILSNNIPNLVRQVKLSSQPTNVKQYQAVIDEIQRIKKSFCEPKEKSDDLTVNQDKKCSNGHPLNVKFNKVRKSQNSNLENMAKKKISNENKNQQAYFAASTNRETLQKLFLAKCSINGQINSKKIDLKLKIPGGLPNSKVQLKIKEKPTDRKFSKEKTFELGK